MTGMLKNNYRFTIFVSRESYKFAYYYISNIIFYTIIIYKSQDLDLPSLTWAIVSTRRVSARITVNSVCL